MLDIFEKLAIISHVPDAGVAHPVERHLAKVEVASSSLVTRSIKDHTFVWSFFFCVYGSNRSVRREEIMLPFCGCEKSR